MIVEIAQGHVTARMMQRGIKREDIENALRTCIQHLPGHSGSATTHVGYAMNNDLLKVWTMDYADHNGTLTVKSAAWKGR